MKRTNGKSKPLPKFHGGKAFSSNMEPRDNLSTDSKTSVGKTTFQSTGFNKMKRKKENKQTKKTKKTKTKKKFYQ